jgi:hypothetical protein
MNHFGKLWSITLDFILLELINSDVEPDGSFVAGPAPGLNQFELFGIKDSGLIVNLIERNQHN